MSKFLKTFWADESGISSIEYALLLAFIAAGIAIAAGDLGDAVQQRIADAVGCVDGTNSGACAAAP